MYHRAYCARKTNFPDLEALAILSTNEITQKFCIFFSMLKAPAAHISELTHIFNCTLDLSNAN